MVRIYLFSNCNDLCVEYFDTSLDREIKSLFYRRNCHYQASHFQIQNHFCRSKAAKKVRVREFTAEFHAA